MNKKGFTLIELVVTMAVSSIFFTLALNLYGSANNAFLNYKITHEFYFEYNVMKANADRQLRENPGECTPDGNYIFRGDKADSLNEVFPFPAPKCKTIDSKRNLIYFTGIADSTINKAVGYSQIVDR